MHSLKLLKFLNIKPHLLTIRLGRVNTLRSPILFGLIVQRGVVPTSAFMAARNSSSRRIITNHYIITIPILSFTSKICTFGYHILNIQSAK